MFVYQAYGLSIHSDLELPELIVSRRNSDPADVTIRSGSVEHPSDVPHDDMCLRNFPGEAILYWPDIGTFQINEGREIIIDRKPEVSDSALRLYVLGSGFGVLLHQRGYLVLHASAVAINGVAVAFLGDKGWGKSTLSAALYARSHPLLSDDLVTITNDKDGSPMVIPGYPQFKLWPEALESLGSNPENLPRIRPELEKRAQRVESGFSHTPCPLGCIYLLSNSAELSIEPVAIQPAFLQLVRHSYVARYGRAFLTGPGGSRHMEQCAWLARRVPIRLLKRKPDLSALSDTAVMIEGSIMALNTEAQ